MNGQHPRSGAVRAGFARTSVLLLMAVSFLASGLAFAIPSSGTASAAATQPTRDAVHVRVTADGFEPSTVSVIAGQTVVFDNETGAERTIVADNSVFDS